MKKIEPGNYLITTSQWFFGPDGEQYKAVWGKAELLLPEDDLGFIPSRYHANWSIKVSGGKSFTIIAGCQVKVLLLCPNKPKIKKGSYIAEPSKIDMPNNSILILK